MSEVSLRPIQLLYSALQSQVIFRPLQGPNSDAAQFASNLSRPVHCWFRFKEGFSAEVLTEVGVNVRGLEAPGALFVDPFCGSGTTLVAGDIEYGWGACRVGFEVNPFLHFVSKVKSEWRAYNPEVFSRAVDRVLAKPLRTDIPPSEWPALVTLHNSTAIPPNRVSELVDAVRRARSLRSPERDLVLLGVAAAVERVSYFRKDGRALRLLSGSEKKAREANTVEGTLRQACKAIKDDLLALNGSSRPAAGPVEVVLGDGRSLDFPATFGDVRGQVSMFAYSPPYLNHIDYTEVYKVEAWLLGFIREARGMLEQRRKTLRSHASVLFEADGTQLPTEVTEPVDLAASEIERTGKRWHKHFRRTALSYFEDMRITLTRQYELLIPGGCSVCVVANSAHGSGGHRVPIAVDLLISSIARMTGFERVEIVEIRRLSRRNTINEYLRESAVIMHKVGPNG